MTPSDRKTMTPSPDQRPQTARRLRPRARFPESPRSKHGVRSEYPIGYLAQLARPFTTRRAGGDRGLVARFTRAEHAGS